MAKKINRSEYDIRTLSYYQGLGGVYNDIITILVKMRNEAAHRGMPSPAQILNEASYYIDCGCMFPDALNGVVLCVMACLGSDNKDFMDCLQKQLAKDSVYYPIFKPLIDNLGEENKKNDGNVELKDLEYRVKELNDIIASQNETIAKQSSVIDSLQSERDAVKKRCVIAEQSQYDGSEFDRLLTLDIILQWIESRHHYMYTEQVFRMLADLKDKVATDEERAKIQVLENRMLDKNQTTAIFNQNYAVGSNMMTGMVSNPQLPIGVSPADFQRMFQQFIEQMNHGKGKGEL